MPMVTESFGGWHEVAVTEVERLGAALARQSGSAGGLTSLEASLVRCFTFSETSPKTSRGDVFFKTSLEHRTVKQKVRCFYTMF
jgi:hypothetical protein